MNVERIQAELKQATNRELLACRTILHMNMNMPLVVGDREDIQRRLDLVNIEIENRTLLGTFDENVELDAVYQKRKLGNRSLC